MQNTREAGEAGVHNRTGPKTPSLSHVGAQAGSGTHVVRRGAHAPCSRGRARGSAHAQERIPVTEPMAPPSSQQQESEWLSHWPLQSNPPKPHRHLFQQHWKWLAHFSARMTVITRPRPSENVHNPWLAVAGVRGYTQIHTLGSAKAALRADGVRQRCGAGARQGSAKKTISDTTA